MITNPLQSPKSSVAVIVAVSLVFGVMIGLGIQTSEAEHGDPRHIPEATDIYTPTRNSDPKSQINIEDDTRIGSISGEASTAPSAKLISIDKYHANEYNKGEVSYRITFSLTAGEQHLRDILIHGKSDLANIEYKVSELNAHTTSIHVVRIMALNPDSITGEIVGYSLTGPT